MLFKNNKTKLYISSTGFQCWYKNRKNGKSGLHRLDGPAYISPQGIRWWYKKNKLHRTDGPAIIRDDGSKFWYEKGKLIKR